MRAVKYEACLYDDDTKGGKVCPDMSVPIIQTGSV